MLRYPVWYDSMQVPSGKVTDSGGLDNCLLNTLVCTLIYQPDATVSERVDVRILQVFLDLEEAGFNLTVG